MFQDFAQKNYQTFEEVYFGRVVKKAFYLSRETFGGKTVFQ